MSIIANRQEVEGYLAERASTDAGFREQLLSDPKKTISTTLRIKFDDNVKIAVHADTPTELNMVLPIALDADDLSDADLESVAGGSVDYLAGTDIADPSMKTLPSGTQVSGTLVVNATGGTTPPTTTASPISIAKPAPTFTKIVPNLNNTSTYIATPSDPNQRANPITYTNSTK